MLNIKKQLLPFFPHTNAEPNVIFVDENDTALGACPKKESRAKGYITRMTRVFLFNAKGETLIQKRSAHVFSNPLRWDNSAAGNVDERESYEEAARREAIEEIGVTDLDLKEVAKNYTEEKDERFTKKRFTMIYSGIYEGEIHPNLEEVTEVRWIGPEELEQWMAKSPNDFTPGFVLNFQKLRAVTQSSA